MNPKLSVCMPVYNAQEYLKEAIDSILNQTYKNFEFIIIDDGSTDESLSIIKNYSDQRIKLYINDVNKGLPYTRNLGLSYCSGEYIALMDADDIAHRERFEKQIEFLNHYPEYGVVGSDTTIIVDNKIRSRVHKYGSYSDVSVGLICNNTLSNSTAMFRRAIVEQYHIYYRKECFVAQDYAFWVDLSKYSKIAKIHQPLLNYRTGHENISKKSKINKVTERKQILDQIRIRALENLSISLEKKDKELFNEIFSENVQDFKLENIEKYISLLNHMIEIGKERNIECLEYTIKKAFLIKVTKINDYLKNKIKLFKWCLKNQRSTIKYEFLLRILFFSCIRRN